jgi:tRNA dimethylallyltransferase
MSMAEAIARHAPVTIISADSRQIYRGFDVGTAKPTSADRARLPHEGIDVAEPTARYSAAAWAASADQWIARSRAEGRIPIVVGGTGLYLRALFEGLFQEPSLDADRRERLAAELARLDVAELRRWVAMLDPARAHLGRTQLLRAVEMSLLTGQRLSDLHRDRATAPRWRPRYLLVDPGPALAERIAARIDDMLDHGWPDEVMRLMHTVPADAPAWNATGYNAVRRLVAGSITRADARQEILIATRQYAKRQRTWFRHQLPAERVTTIDPTASDWHAAVNRWMDESALAGGQVA